jgi:hypothetical protein
LGWRVGFVSTRLHNWVQQEPYPIINRVESLNPNTTRLPTELPEHDPGNPFTFFDSLNSEEAYSESSEEEGSYSSSSEKDDHEAHHIQAMVVNW